MVEDKIITLVLEVKNIKLAEHLIVCYENGGLLAGCKIIDYYRGDISEAYEEMQQDVERVLDEAFEGGRLI